MNVLKSRVLAAFLLSCAMSACTVGDTTQGRPDGNGVDAGSDVDTPDAEAATSLKWTDATLTNANLKAAMHYVSATEIYAIIGQKVCVWDGTEWKAHSTDAPAVLSAAMHFVAPNQIYAVIGLKVCMWDGIEWVAKTGDNNEIADGLGNAEIHVSGGSVYAVLGNKVCVWNPAGEGTWDRVTPDGPLQYAMHFVSPGEIYAVLGTKICKWTTGAAAWAVVSPDQANLKPGLQVVSENEMYAVIGEKVCKWDGTGWADITDAVTGLMPEFVRTDDNNILAVANGAVTHWAPVAE